MRINKLKTVCITNVDGNSQRLDGGAMFGNAPRVVWEKWCPPDSQGRILLACRTLLIEYDKKKILCETGIGSFFEPKLRDRYGVVESDHRLLANLKNLGINESEIDFVILSHLHFDHAGGLLPSYDANSPDPSRLLFPNAKYLVGKEAWQRALKPHPRDRASFIPQLQGLLQSSNRLVIVDGDKTKECFPDRLSFLYSHGHTPGQMHALFAGDNQKVFFAGDLVPGVAWVHLPITMGYDRFPEMVIDEKKLIYDRAVPEEWLVFYTHDDKTVASTITKDEHGRYSAHDRKNILAKYEI